MSVLHNAIITALRDAGPEGLSEGEMAIHGGGWWRERVEEIRRWKRAVIGEQNGRYYLVVEPEARAENMPCSPDAAQPPSADLTLFPRSSSPYDVREAA